ncbi:MAG TPA: hypothetical protein VN906_10645 [Candidatus Sulfotelmatobacter sp.]|nr:hypothetical protein [Candidatus Sulfotelmatobacter sp.]
MRVLLLKAGATAVTVVATVASALYVSAHLKNPAAPLQPSVLNANGGGPAVTALGGTVTVGPSVRPGNTQPVTSTYAS